MYWDCEVEYNSKLCQEIVHELVSSSSNASNMKNDVLKKVLAQLMNLTFKGSDGTVNNSSWSLPFENDKSKKTVTEGILKRKRNVPVANISPTIYKEKVNKNNSKKIKEKQAIVYLNDILSTPEKISKCEFLEYFQLKDNKSVTNDIHDNKKIINNKFQQSYTIPISSELGKSISRVNNNVSEHFFSRRLSRCERYVNKPIQTNINEDIEYPVTYVEKKLKKNKKTNKNNNKNINKKLGLSKKECERVCYVKLPRMDLLEKKRVLDRGLKSKKRKLDETLKKKNRKKVLLMKMRMHMKKCRPFSVDIKAREKKIVDELLTKKKSRKKR